MKKPFLLLPAALAAGALLLSFPLFMSADETTFSPSLNFTTGLAGQQARVTWPAQPGVQYRVRKSGSLGQETWVDRALVTASSTTASWTDPEPTGRRDFYQVPAPQPEVFSVEPAVISPGGELIVRAQCLPSGSSLMIELEGLPPIVVPLVPQPDGTYRVSLPAFAMPAQVTAVRVITAGGAPVVTVDQTFEVTATGRASDTPPGEPPAAPVSNMKGDINQLFANDHSYSMSHGHGMGTGKASFDDHVSVLGPTGGTGGAGKVSIRDISYMGKVGTPAGKGAQRRSGETSLGDFVIVKCDALPGEVSFQQRDLSVATPAGPALHWVSTYRSKKGGMTSDGGGWTSCFDIRIEPIPLSAGTSAPRVALYSGNGQRHILQRQADGSYRCDGMFREGRFNPDTSFTLTFADKGTWIFCPLVGAPWQGRIGSIVDRNGVGLTCTYTPGGKLATVSSQFGQSVMMTYGPGGELLTVGDQTGRFIEIHYYVAGESGGSQGDVKSVSCPQMPGLPPVAGPTTYTYTTGFADDALNHNLLSMRDGAGRLLAEFTYSATTDPALIDYDTTASSDFHRTNALTGNVTLYKFEIAPPGVFPPGSYMMLENDPLGRVREYVFNAHHCCISCRDYTGFATPGVSVTSMTNRPAAASKLRAGDLDYYETTFAYNPDHRIKNRKLPDGTQELTTFDRDLRPNCPVRERGNARVMTLRALNGDERTVTCDYLPGFGTSEVARGVGGSKKSRSNISNNFATVPGGSVWDGGDGEGGCTDALIPTRKVWHEKRQDFVVTGGGSVWDGGDGNGGCTGMSSREVATKSSSNIQNNFTAGGGAGTGSGNGGGAAKGKGEHKKDCICETCKRVSYIMVHHTPPPHHMPPPPKGPSSGGFCTAMTTAHGQRFTASYDSHGNCVSSRTPIAGAGCDATYNSSGQCTSVTVLNGPGSSFRDECVYDPVTGFWSSIICDKPPGGGGLQITTTFERDTLGRITRVIDPRGHDWLYEYNALSVPVYQRTPLTGTSRITTQCFYDAAGLLARCDVEHHDETGALVAANPAYSTFYVYDNRARLVRVAEEERPVDPPTAPPVLDPAILGISNFAVVDFTFDDAGQCVRVSTPAACREQATDAVCDYEYDELRRHYRSTSGGLGSITGVTVQTDYDPAGAVIRRMLLPTLPPPPPFAPNPEVTWTYDGFHRLASCTDPMGNVVTYTYDNQGFVTTTVSGEVIDGPGSAGNTLLARSSSRGIAVDCRRPFAPEQASLNPGVSGGGGGGGSAGRFDWRLLPAYMSYLPDMEVEDPMLGCLRRYRPAFFDVFVTDDVWTSERFAPGEPAPHPTETTTVHRSPAGLVQSVSRNGDTLLTFTYDTAGRMATCSDGFTVNGTVRDQNGNVVLNGRTDLSTLAGTPDKTFTRTFTWDPLNRCTSVTDSLSNVASVARDSMHRPVRLINPTGTVTTIHYDGDFNDGLALIPYSSLVAVDVSNDGTPDVLRRYHWRSGVCRSVTTSTGYTTWFTADSQGRVTRCDFPDGTHKSCIFDAHGRLQTETHQDGSTCTNSYSLNGHLTGSVWSNVPAPVIAIDPLMIDLDGLGRTVSCTQGASALTWTYDSLGNELSESHNGLTVTRTFNDRGRTSIIYPDGTRFSESRNVHGHLVTLSAVTAGGTFITPPVVAHEYLGHRILRSTQANGVVTHHTWRGDGDVTIPGTGQDFTIDGLVRSITTNGAGSVLSDDTINRDRNQDVIRTDTFFADEAVANRPFRRKLFTLDRLGRITGCVTRFRAAAGGANVIESTVAYTLDLEGKRLTATGDIHPGSYTQSPAPPELDHPMSQYTTWPGGSLTWNDNGSLTHMSDGANSFDCVHDCLGRLVAVNNPLTGAELATYAYDGEGRRTRSTAFSSNPGTPPVTKFFVYDGEACVQELGDDGHADLTFGIGGPALCIISRNGTLVYPHGGGGGTTLITSSSGSLVERVDCDNGGKPIFLTSDGLVRPGATGTISGYEWRTGGCNLVWSPRSNVLLYGRYCHETGFIQCSDGVYSPSLGQPVSLQKDKKKDPPPVKHHELTGHVTLMK